MVEEVLLKADRYVPLAGALRRLRKMSKECILSCQSSDGLLYFTCLNVNLTACATLAIPLQTSKTASHDDGYYRSEIIEQSSSSVCFEGGRRVQLESLVLALGGGEEKSAQVELSFSPDSIFLSCNFNTRTQAIYQLAFEECRPLVPSKDQIVDCIGLSMKFLPGPLLDALGKMSGGSALGIHDEIAFHFAQLSGYIVLLLSGRAGMQCRLAYPMSNIYEHTIAKGHFNSFALPFYEFKVALLLAAYQKALVHLQASGPKHPILVDIIMPSQNPPFQAYFVLSSTNTRNDEQNFHHNIKSNNGSKIEDGESDFELPATSCSDPDEDNNHLSGAEETQINDLDNF